MQILYIGNKLFKYKKIKAVIETLEPLFQEFIDVKTCSDKKNKLIRLFDMIYHYLRYGIFSHKILIDVFSTNSIYFAYLFSITSILLNKKYILFLHGGDLPKRHKISTTLVNFIFKNAEILVSPSNYLASYFLKNGFKVVVIPNVINLKDYPFFERKTIRPKILSIRGFDATYNPIMTLKAVKILKDEIPDIHLFMLGNKFDSMYDEVQNFISTNKLDKNVTIKEKLPLKDWVELSRDFDIMVSNPVIDNTPISIIEGMALGMCIISTNVGGVSYLVEKDNCIMIENGNIKQLVANIKFLINNPNFSSKLSISSRKKSKNYVWSKVKPKWIDILI